MKLILTALCASFLVLPAFSAECDKCKKHEEKKEEGTLAHCGKCGKDGDKKEEEKKEEKKEGTVAHCGKCGKDGDKKEEEKKEGTLA